MSLQEKEAYDLAKCKLAEYLQDSAVCSMDEYVQHGTTSTLQHCGFTSTQRYSTSSPPICGR